MKHMKMTKKIAFMLFICMLVTICSSFGTAGSPGSFSSFSSFDAPSDVAENDIVNNIYTWTLQKDDGSYYERGQLDSYDPYGYLNISDWNPNKDELDTAALNSYADKIKGDYKIKITSYNSNFDNTYYDINDVSYMGTSMLTFESWSGVAPKKVYLFEIVLDTNYAFKWNNQLETKYNTDSDGYAHFYVYIEYKSDETPEPPSTPEPLSTTGLTDTLANPGIMPIIEDTVTTIGWGLTHKSNTPSYRMNISENWEGTGYISFTEEADASTSEALASYAENIKENYFFYIRLYWHYDELGEVEDSGDGNSWWHKVSIRSVTYDAEKTWEVRSAGEQVCMFAVQPEASSTFIWGNGRFGSSTDGNGNARFYIKVPATGTPPTPEPPTPIPTLDPNATPLPTLNPDATLPPIFDQQQTHGWRLRNKMTGSEYKARMWEDSSPYISGLPDLDKAPTQEALESYANDIGMNYNFVLLLYGNYSELSQYNPTQSGNDWLYSIPIRGVRYDAQKTYEVITSSTEEKVCMFEVVPDVGYTFTWHQDYSNGGVGWDKVTPNEGVAHFYIKVNVTADDTGILPTPGPSPTPKPTQIPRPTPRADLATLTPQDVKDHIVNKENHATGFGGPIVNPSGVTVNLFDYWLDGTADEPNGTGNFDVPNWRYNNSQDNTKNNKTMKSGNWFQMGINKGHMLLFGGGNRFKAWQQWGESRVTHILGAWNFYTGNSDVRKKEDDTTTNEVEGGKTYHIKKDDADNDVQNRTEYSANREQNELIPDNMDSNDKTQPQYGEGGRGGPNYGLVQNNLGENGYPVLNLNNTDAKPFNLPEWEPFDSRGQPWVYYGMSEKYNGSSWWLDGSAPWPGFYIKGAGDTDAGEAPSVYRDDMTLDELDGIEDALKSRWGAEDRSGGYFNFNDLNSSNFNENAITEETLTESLDYLFDPTADTDYRKTYEDVRGMFRLDREGYYYYNAADDDGKKGRENVYGYLGTNPEQKIDDENKKYYEMTLYDVPFGTQFFPFDEWEKSFGKDEEGNVVSNGYDLPAADGDVNIEPYAHHLNHFFGMTLEADFRQPLNGLVNKKDMIFDFSGDDDVWIYVDGVLVGDVGGVHSKIDINIDFATGEVTTFDRVWNLENDNNEVWRDVTSLYNQFRKAYNSPTKVGEARDGYTYLPPLDKIKNPDKDDAYNAGRTYDVPEGWEWNNDETDLVFKVGTVHKLNFFYMERGHEESNLSLSYNFPEFWPGRLHKVDEDGKELDGAEFELYPAEYVGSVDANGDSTLTAQEIKAIINDPDWDSQWYHKVSEFKISGDPIATGIKPEYQDENNKSLLMHYAQMLDAEGLPIAYSQRFYILREVTTPKGYRSVRDTVLEYHEKTGTLTAVNRYETGVYASFMAKWIGSVFTRSADTIPFADYNPCEVKNNKDENGNQTYEGNPFPTSTEEGEAHAADLAEGLTIVVPTIRQMNGKKGEVNPNKNLWYPMYGSNTAGWHTVFPGDEATAEWDNEDEKLRYVQIADRTKPALMTALITAAFIQMSDDNTREWYLEWQRDMQRLEGFMENLPGNSTRYLRVNLQSTDMNEDADLNLVPLFIPKEALIEIVYGGDANNYPDPELTDEELEAMGYDSFSDVLYNDLKKFVQDQANAEKPWFDSETGDPIIANIKAYLEEKYNEGLKSIDMLDNSSFGERQYRTVIYVPNERRELRIRKVDEDGNYINGAVFAVFDTSAEAYNFGLEHGLDGENTTEFTSAAKAIEALATDDRPLSYGMTDTVTLDTVATPQEGTLIFRGGDTTDGVLDKGLLKEGKYGISYIGWNSNRIADDDDAKASGVGDNIYWIKEIYAPMGYDRNTNLIRVEIGDAAVLANATGYEFIPQIDSETGEKIRDEETGKVLGSPQLLMPEPGKTTVDDGIIVRAALGKLAQTLTKFAMGDNVNVTLRDITAFKQTQTGGANGQLDTSAWYEEDKDPNVDRSNTYAYKFNLHFGKNALDLTGQYGRHTAETATLPIFEAKDGYIRVMPRQNLNDVSQYLKSDHVPYTAYDKLVDESGEAFDLEGLFTLMNIVVVEDTTRPAILELSKQVENDSPDEVDVSNDSYQFSIGLKYADGGSLEYGTIYDAYIHPTDHQFDVLDEYGEATGEKRPCIHADSGHTPMYVYIDNEGNCKFMANKDADTSDEENLLEYITLKDGETFVILNLPQGAQFAITETIDRQGEYEYSTTITVDDYKTTDPKFVKDDDERTASGVLNSMSVSDDNTENSTDTELPSVKVHYLNSIGAATPSVTPNPPDPGDLPSTGGRGVTLLVLLGSFMLATVIGYEIYEKKKKAKQQTS